MVNFSAYPDPLEWVLLLKDRTTMESHNQSQAECRSIDHRIWLGTVSRYVGGHIYNKGTYQVQRYRKSAPAHESFVLSPGFARLEKPTWRTFECCVRPRLLHGKIGDCEQSISWNSQNFSKLEIDHTWFFDRLSTDSLPPWCCYSWQPTAASVRFKIP